MRAARYPESSVTIMSIMTAADTDGLRGEEIPMLSRIIAIADAFDAIIDRPYRSCAISGLH